MTKMAAALAMREDDLPPVLNADEVASLLRISRRTLERHLTNGTFPIPTLAELRTGTKQRRLLWSRANVLAYVAAESRPMIKAGLRGGKKR